VRGRRQRGKARAVGRPSGDAWARAVAGGGARALHRRWAAGQKQSRGESEGDRGRRSRQESEGPVCNLRNFQGLLCKEKFPIDTKS
jgi:hypothetical protein